MLFNTVLFTGNANPVLAQEIATQLGSELGKAKVGRFSDGECDVEIHQNVRARDVFVVQSTGAPTNENVMELLIMVDALKRASARRITAVIPYFGYARQDRRSRSTRVPISAKVVANLLQTVGVERLLTMDLHADQIQGFFDIPVDNIYASPVLLTDVKSKNYQDLVVVSPDVGGVVRARALARFNASTMISSSITFSFVGAPVDWTTKTSRARTFCWISTSHSPSEKRPTLALPSSEPS